MARCRLSPDLEREGAETPSLKTRLQSRSKSRFDIEPFYTLAALGIELHLANPHPQFRRQNMTVTENKALMNLFVEFINTTDLALGEQLISHHAVFHVPGYPEPLRGLQGYLQIIAMMRLGFPDIKWTLDEIIAENDKIAARFTMRGTHQGVFFGVPATSKKIAVQALNIYRFEDGKIIEERGQPDLMGLMQQIGALSH